MLWNRKCYAEISEILQESSKNFRFLTFLRKNPCFDFCVGQIKKEQEPLFICRYQFYHFHCFLSHRGPDMFAQ